MDEPHTLERFASRLGQRFEVVDAPAGCTLELVEAKPLADGAHETGGRVPFALLFRGPCDPALAQALYTLRNDTLGADAVFLVPVGADPEGALYEAVFN